MVLTAALSVATATWAPAAFAQAAPTIDDRSAAAKDFADGDRAFKNGDYRAAAESYEAAYKVLPHHAALWNAARSWHRAGDLPRAANLYARYLQEAPPSARDRNSAIKALNELSSKVAHLQIHATDVADVKVDGVALQASDVYVTPGAHVVEGQTRDGHNVRQSQNVEAGDTVSVALMAPASGASGPAASPVSAPAESPQTRPSHGWSPIFVYFGGAVTAVLAGITVWSGIDTLQRKDAFDQTPTQSSLDVGKQAQTRTNVLIGATVGVGVLTGLAAIFLVDWHSRTDVKSDSSPPPGSAGVRDLRLGVGPGALLLQGDF